MFYYDRVKSGNEANLAVVDQHLRKRGMGRWMRSEFYRFLENIESNVQNIGGNVDNYMFDEWAHEFVKAYEAHGVEIPALQIDESVGKQKDVDLAVPIGGKKKKKQKSLSQEEQKTLQEKKKLAGFIILARNLTKAQHDFYLTRSEMETTFKKGDMKELLQTEIKKKFGSLIEVSEIPKNIVDMNTQYSSEDLKYKVQIEKQSITELERVSEIYNNTQIFQQLSWKPSSYTGNEDDAKFIRKKTKDYERARETLGFLDKWMRKTAKTIIEPFQLHLQKFNEIISKHSKEFQDNKKVKDEIQDHKKNVEAVSKKFNEKIFKVLELILKNYHHEDIEQYFFLLESYKDFIRKQVGVIQNYFERLKNNEDAEDSDGSSDEDDDFGDSLNTLFEIVVKRFELETRALERRRYLESFARKKRDFQKKLRQEELDKEKTLKKEETKRIQREKQEFEERAQKHEYIFPKGGGSSVLFNERYDDFKKQKGKPYVRRGNENERLRVGGENEKKMLKEQAKKRTEQAIQNRSKGIEIKAPGIKPKDLWRYLPQGNSAYSIQKVEFTKKSVPLEEARKLEEVRKVEEMNKAIEEERELEEIIKAIDLIGSSVSARPPIRAENLPFARFIGKKIEAQS